MTSIKLPSPLLVRGGAARRIGRQFAITLPGTWAPLPRDQTGHFHAPVERGVRPEARVRAAPEPASSRATPRALRAHERPAIPPSFRRQALRTYQRRARLTLLWRVAPLTTRLFLLAFGATLIGALTIANLG